MSGQWLRFTAGFCLAGAAAAAFAQEPSERLYVLVSPLSTAGPSGVVAFDGASDGAFVQGGTYEIGGQGRGRTAPQAMAIDADARFLFVTNNTSLDVSVLAIGSDGALSPVPTSPVPLNALASTIATHPRLARLYVPNYYGDLSVFAIDGAGGLDLLESIDAGYGPRGVAVSPSGSFLYLIGGFADACGIHAYDVVADGTLSEIAGSPFPLAESRSFTLAVSPDGQRLYAHDIDLGIFAFDVRPTGALTPVTGSPFAAGTYSDTLALAPDGWFVYADAPFGEGIFGFAAAGPSLVPVPESPFEGDFIAAALLPSVASSRMYFVGRDTARISTFDIDPEGRLVLGPRTNVVDAAGRLPSSAVVRAPSLSSIAVDIDVKPGSVVNPVNLRGRGVIPVAILGSAGLDVSTVDVASVRFGPSGAPPVQGTRIADVDGDGEPDLELHFRTAESGIACGDSSAGLTGSTEDGRRFHGDDAIVTLGCHSGGRAPVDRPRHIEVGPSI